MFLAVEHGIEKRLRERGFKNYANQTFGLRSSVESLVN